MSNAMITPAARRDLSAIWAYSERTWSGEQADKYIDDIGRSIDAMTVGAAVLTRWPEVREDIVSAKSGRHLVFAAVGDGLTVVAVLHEATDYLTRLEGRIG